MKPASARWWLSPLALSPLALALAALACALPGRPNATPTAVPPTATRVIPGVGSTQVMAGNMSSTFDTASATGYRIPAVLADGQTWTENFTANTTTIPPGPRRRAIYASGGAIMGNEMRIKR